MSQSRCGQSLCVKNQATGQTVKMVVVDLCGNTGIDMGESRAAAAAAGARGACMRQRTFLARASGACARCLAHAQAPARPAPVSRLPTHTCAACSPLLPPVVPSPQTLLASTRSMATGPACATATCSPPFGGAEQGASRPPPALHASPRPEAPLSCTKSRAWPHLHFLLLRSRVHHS